MRHHRLTVANIATALSLLAALIMGVPYLLNRLYYRHDHTFETTKWIMLGYCALFFLFAGIFTPLVRSVWKFFKLSGTSPLDSLTTVLIAFPALVALVFLWPSALWLMRWKYTRRYKYHIYNALTSTTFFLMGALVRFRGIPPKKDQQYISIFNHSSGEPDYILASIVKGTRPWNIVAGINLRHNKTKVGDWILTKTIGKVVEDHSIHIDRTNEESRHRALRRIVEEINNGKNIAIFPEGTRTKYRDIVEKKVILQKFWYPIFKLAYDRNIPIQPTVFDWPVIWRGKDDPRFGIHPCTIDAHFLEMVYPSKFDSYESMMEHCWNMMHAKLASSKKVQRFLK